VVNKYQSSTKLKVAEVNQPQIDKVLNMDLDELCNLITDSSGNYVVQEVVKDKN